MNRRSEPEQSCWRCSRASQARSRSSSRGGTNCRTGTAISWRRRPRCASAATSCLPPSITSHVPSRRSRHGLPALVGDARGAPLDAPTVDRRHGPGAVADTATGGRERRDPRRGGQRPFYNVIRVIPGGWCLQCKHPFDPDHDLKQRAARWGVDVGTVRAGRAIEPSGRVRQSAHPYHAALLASGGDRLQRIAGS